MAIQSITRTIFFYDLLATFDPDFVLEKEKYNSNFQALLSDIKKLVQKKDNRRYQEIGERVRRSQLVSLVKK